MLPKKEYYNWLSIKIQKEFCMLLQTENNSAENYFCCKRVKDRQTQTDVSLLTVSWISVCSVKKGILWNGHGRRVVCWGRWCWFWAPIDAGVTSCRFAANACLMLGLATLQSTWRRCRAVHAAADGFHDGLIKTATPLGWDAGIYRGPRRVTFPVWLALYTGCYLRCLPAKGWWYSLALLTRW